MEIRSKIALYQIDIVNPVDLYALIFLILKYILRNKITHKLIIDISSNWSRVLCVKYLILINSIMENFEQTHRFWTIKVI